MITVKIGGAAVPLSAIRAWESKRLAWSARYLQRKLGLAERAREAEALLRLKYNTPEAEMRRSLRRTLGFGRFGARLMTRLSFGKRKLCVTEFEVKGIRAKHMHELFNALMLENSEENRMACLAACPDHYLLKGGGVQEVIEVAGSLFIPMQFFIHYGDESGLVSKKDSGYPFQAVGAARLADGFAMGGARHQMRDTDSGCAVKLLIEFPYLFPGRNIKEHQFHLACEFYNWFEEVLRRYHSLYADFPAEIPREQRAHLA